MSRNIQQQPTELTGYAGRLGSRMPARPGLQLALGASVLAVSALAGASFGASRHAHPALLQLRAEAGHSIAAQGNLALRKIREDARRNVALARPAPLAELGQRETQIARFERN